MAKEISKAYEPQQIEQRWAQIWAEQQLFRADLHAPGPVFSIVVPPPNVTGSLHIGHMLEHTQIDILTRWHRMQGYNTLYLPGMDHAGIATQRVVVQLLREQGIDYRQLGRTEFEKRVWQWKAEYGGQITRQMVQLGESCDWTRERFTLSPEYSRAVREVFVRLYEQGLVYRGHYIVNWCPSCQTAISDLETMHEERNGQLWYIRYPVVGVNQSVVIATTRPETMLGDTAVAVHPEDERYAHLVGKKVLLPLMQREIPVIADRFVDREFGTGVVKVTPAHDPNDFQAAQRHNLPEIDVMTDDARMSAAAGNYAGLDRFQARQRIVEDLKAQGLLERVVDHRYSVGTCDRCKTVIEPRASTQWFVRMKPLAEPAIGVVERGEIEILPENWRSVYFEWMRNIRDWCISRQLWWGHPIPAWHCKDCPGITVARETPTRCASCGCVQIEQDPDVLETWFSSALWPFATLGWPERTEDLTKYYPTSLLITGYEILFFWVARMIMMGLRFTGQIPFRRVYLHSIVRDSEGLKMSKSKGTGIDPVALNQKYGTDAMRFTLAILSAPGTDILWSEERVLSYRSFANKIWNAARFLFVNLEKFERTGATIEDLAAPEVRAGAPYRTGGVLGLAERWIFSRLARVTQQVTEALKQMRFHEATHLVYHFFWGQFCDWYIEWVKPELALSEDQAAKTAWRNLFAVFEAALRLLHPFMPFLTEELWQQLPQRTGARSIALERYPEAQTDWLDDQAEREMSLLQEIVGAARNLRAEMKLDPKRKVAADLSTADATASQLVEANREPVLRLATLSGLQLATGRLDPAAGPIRSTARFDLRIPYREALDVRAEVARLRKEKERLARDVESKQSRLSDRAFRTRAPEEIVRSLESTLKDRQLEFQKLTERLAQLEKNLGDSATT